jgi:hypothetical protein
MRKTFLGLGVLGAAMLGGLSTPVQATTYVETRTMSRYIACYDRVYVPARVLVNTRGRQVRAPGTAWEISGTRWDNVRTLGVYIQTERVIEQDHHTLRRRPC